MEIDISELKNLFKYTCNINLISIYIKINIVQLNKTLFLLYKNRVFNNKKWGRCKWMENIYYMAL